MRTVKLCINKILQFLTGVRLKQVDLYNGHKMVVDVVVTHIIHHTYYTVLC